MSVIFETGLLLQGGLLLLVAAMVALAPPVPLRLPARLGLAGLATLYAIFLFSEAAAPAEPGSRTHASVVSATLFSVGWLVFVRSAIRPLAREWLFAILPTALFAGLTAAGMPPAAATTTFPQLCLHALGGFAASTAIGRIPPPWRGWTPNAPRLLRAGFATWSGMQFPLLLQILDPVAKGPMAGISLFTTLLGSTAALLALLLGLRRWRPTARPVAAPQPVTEPPQPTGVDFVAGFSQEIRTPLNGVIGAAELLSLTTLSEQQKDFVETIRNSSESLLLTLNDALDFARVESGRLDLEDVEFDLDPCFEAALDMVAPRLSQKGLDFGYFVRPAVPSRLRGDPTRLRQVFSNLLANAAKSSGRGEIEVVLDGEPSGRRHFLLRGEVRASGPAATPASPAQAAAEGTSAGTGLGLAVCRLLLERMGGWLESESEPGRGSVFRFGVRLGLPEAPDREVALALRGRRAWLLEPNGMTRRVIHGFLDAWGMAVENLASSEAAFAKAAAGETADVILCALDLPEAGGLNTLRALRRHEGLRLCPAVMVAPIDYIPEDLSAFYDTVCDSVTRPVRRTRLLDALLLAFNAMPPARSRITLHVRLDARLARKYPLRILLAEDNPINRKVALQMLRHMGYDADAARNGLEVLSALERAAYDVILMDVRMPEMDGLETTRHLLERYPAGRRPRIVALTAHALRGDRERFLDAGMDDYLVKPVRVQELQEALVRAASRQSAPEHPEEMRLARSEFTPTVDFPVLDEVARGYAPEFVALLREFVADLPRMLGEVEEARRSGDRRRVTEKAHQIKGAALNFGFARLGRMLLQLEQAAETPDAPLAFDPESALQEVEVARVIVEKNRLTPRA